MRNDKKKNQLIILVKIRDFPLFYLLDSRLLYYIRLMRAQRLAHRIHTQKIDCIWSLVCQRNLFITGIR